MNESQRGEITDGQREKMEKGQGTKLMGLCRRADEPRKNEGAQALH